MFKEQEKAQTSTSAAVQNSSKLDSDEILKRVDEILLLPGKKGTEPTSLIASLKEMLTQAEDYVQVRIFVAILVIAFL